jgi:hypothetical protein
MSIKLGSLLLFLLFGWGGAVAANAQTFDVTVSVTAVIGPEGFSMSSSSVSAVVSTKMNDWSITSTTAFSLTFDFLGETLVASGKVSDYNVKSELFLDLKNPISEILTISTQMGSWTLSSITTVSIAMDLSKVDLVGEGIKIANKTKDGVGLSSTTTVNFEGFKSESFTISGMVADLSIVQTTVIGKTGLSQSIWDLSATVEGFSLFRETIYTAEGFSSDMLSVDWTVDKYDLNVTSNFGKTGWINKSITVGTTFKGLGASAPK